MPGVPGCVPAVGADRKFFPQTTSEDLGSRKSKKSSLSTQLTHADPDATAEVIDSNTCQPRADGVCQTANGDSGVAICDHCDRDGKDWTESWGGVRKSLGGHVFVQVQTFSVQTDTRTVRVETLGVPSDTFTVPMNTFFVCVNTFLGGCGHFPLATHARRVNRKNFLTDFSHPSLRRGNRRSLLAAHALK